MELKFEDIVKMNMMQLEETVTSESITRFLGNIKSSAEEKFPLDFSNEDWVTYEKVLLYDTVENLYRLIAFVPVFFAVAISNNELKKPESVKGYSQNMNKIYNGLLRLEEEVNTAVALKREHLYKIFSDKKTRTDFTEFMKFMKQVMPFFDHAVKAEKVCLKAKGPSVEFFDSINQYNKEMRDALSSALPLVGDWSDLKEHFLPMYFVISGHFDEHSKNIDSKREEFVIKAEQQKKDMEEKIKQAKQRETVVSVMEQVRRKSINEANDLWQMFQLDFMRDLNKEVSMMNRDMYEALMDKIAKFLKKFPMPLANDVSAGMAEEAKKQINRFIETVEEISRATYTPVVMNRQ